jgi:hypothetical protein
MALPNKPVGELKAVRDPEVVEKEKLTFSSLAVVWLPAVPHLKLKNG